MAFNGVVLTTLGKNLQVKVQTGVQLAFTKVKIGDGVLGTNQSLEALTNLLNPKMTLNIQGVAVLGDGTSRVRTIVTNADLTAGFFVREIGVFATDPDVGEILYCIGNAGSECDYLPAAGSVVVEETLDVIMAVGNATNITAVIDESIVLATKADITEHNNNSSAHSMAMGFWQNAHVYAVGEIIRSRIYGSYKYMECTVGGTSGTTEPTWPAVGSPVTDGTVGDNPATWVVRDIRVADAADDNSGKKVTTSWLRTNIQPLVSGCIAAVATAAGFACSLSANGYIKLPSWLGGLILQWGSVNVPANSTATVTLPLDYPNAIVNVQACHGVGGWAQTYTSFSTLGGAWPLSLSQINISSTDEYNVPFYWLAIGY